MSLPAEQPGLILPRYRADAPGTHPPLASADYRSTALRSPGTPLIVLPHRLTEVTGPLFGAERLAPGDADLTAGHAGDPVGQRIIVHGRVLDGDGRPVPNTLLELWQANASGRYRHVVDDWPGTLDPNFDGTGRTVTDAQGRYEFTTIKPGAYPWRNHPNAWRPAHIHFSLFGTAFTQRLITQMYFPGDPLFFQDPIFNSVPDPAARQRLISRFDLDRTRENWALAYEFDIVLRGRAATPWTRTRTTMMSELPSTPSQTVGPFLSMVLPWPDGPYAVAEDTPDALWISGTVYDGEGTPVPDALIETWQADPDGRFSHPDDPRGAVPAKDGFRGFARCPTDAEGRYRIFTVKPGSLPTSDGEVEAPHLNVSVFARGLLHRVVTRLYFPDETQANATDPVLNSISDVQARATLLAVRGAAGLRFDIHLQGDHETAFFDV